MVEWAPTYTHWRGIPGRWGKWAQELYRYDRRLPHSRWSRTLEGRLPEKFLAVQGTDPSPDVRLDITSFYQRLSVNASPHDPSCARMNFLRFGAYCETLRPGQYILFTSRWHAEAFETSATSI